VDKHSVFFLAEIGGRPIAAPRCDKFINFFLFSFGNPKLFMCLLNSLDSEFLLFSCCSTSLGTLLLLEYRGLFCMFGSNKGLFCVVLLLLFEFELLLLNGFLVISYFGIANLR